MRVLKKHHYLMISAGSLAVFALASSLRTSSKILTQSLPKAVSRSVAMFESRSPVLLGYTQNEFALQFGHPFTTGAPHWEAGRPERFSITPSLPTGLYIDPSSGAIQGTPELFSENDVVYTVSAVNRNGVSKVQIKFLPITAEKPKVKFAQTVLSLKPGDSVDLPIESHSGPFAWLQLYPENKLPKGVHYDSATRRLIGRVESTDGYSFDNPTQVFFLRAKGFRSITESPLHITVEIPQTPENQQFHGECLSIAALLNQFRISGNPDDVLEETWLATDGAGPRVPSPNFLARTYGKRRWSSPTQTKRHIQRSEWIRHFGYEVDQKDCATALVRKSSHEPWALYLIDAFHSGQRGTIEKGLEHRITLIKQSKNSPLPERIEFTRVTQKPLDPRINWKDYLITTETIAARPLKSDLRCEDEVKSENHLVKISRALQLGILHSRKSGKVFADGGPAQNPGWIQYLQKIADEAPQFSCKFLD